MKEDHVAFVRTAAERFARSRLPRSFRELPELICDGANLCTADQPGIHVILDEPFRAVPWTDECGVIRRKPPLEVLRPPTGYEDVDYILNEDTIESVHVFAADVDQGMLVGERAVVSTDGRLHTDSSSKWHLPAVFALEERRRFEHLHLVSVDGGYKFEPDALPPVYLPGEVLALTAMEHENYGAFLLRSVSKLATIRKLGLSGSPVLTPLTHWHLHILEAFGVDRSRLVPFDKARTYIANNLIVASPRTSEFFLDDGARELFQEQSDRLSGAGCTAGGERLYVSRVSQSRRRPNHRVCLNEPELVHTLARRGFRIFEPEAHSFEDQVRVFRDASVVVGPGGAGMFNTIFCRPKTLVVAIEPMVTWLANHMNMYASMDLEYVILVGGADEFDPAVQKRWWVDVNAVTKLLDSLMA